MSDEATHTHLLLKSIKIIENVVCYTFSMFYFSKTQTVRQTQIIPSQNWGGQGLLGVSIRFCSFEGANQNVWHIVSVQPNSPAERAGLHSNTDYVLGAESVLQHADDLIALVQANIGKSIKVFLELKCSIIRQISYS